MKYSSCFFVVVVFSDSFSIAVKHTVLQEFDNKLHLFYTIFNSRESIKKNNGKQTFYLATECLYIIFNIFNILVDTMADSISNIRQ